MTVFGDRIFKEVPKVELDRKGGTLVRTDVLVRGETRDKQLLSLSSCISQRKGHERTRRRRPSEIQEEASPETSPAGTWTLDFQLPDGEEMHAYCLSHLLGAIPSSPN